MNWSATFSIRSWAAFFCAAALASNANLSGAIVSPVGTSMETVQSEGRVRTFMLHIGKSVDPTLPAPLVIVLHGPGGNGTQMEHASGFDSIADREGFIAAYPSGIGKHWNDGRRSARFDVVKDVDDIQFLRDLVAAVKKIHRVDARRIFCTGMSNGGFMTSRAGVEASDLFAAIAPVSGTLSKVYADRITPKFPISVLIIHGTKDPVVPYAGGMIGKDGPVGECLGAEKIVAKWVQAVGAAPEAATKLLPDKDPHDGCRITEFLHPGARATVEFLSIVGGVHAWPGSGGKRPGICHDINGSEFIWDFFKAHPKP